MRSNIQDFKGQIFLIAIITIIIIPIITVFSYLMTPSTEIWSHLFNTLLLEYLNNTLIILLCVGFAATAIGLISAWVVTMYDFPGKRVFKWLLVLPIALPTYIAAYIYAGLIEPTGLFFDFFEYFFNSGALIYKSIDVRNIGGVIFILSICLYPYIYLLCYSSFSEQSSCALEVGKSLGLNKKELFKKVSLPLARPGIIAGLSLVLMETLAEFATMEYYGVSTFTTGIYRTWFFLEDEASALHLASILLTFVFIVIILENYTRGKSKYFHTSQKIKYIKAEKITGAKSTYAFMWCLTICMLGIIIPVLQILFWLIDTYSYMLNFYFTRIIFNTIFLAGLGALLIVAISMYSSYIKRSTNNIVTRLSIKIYSLGYSIPGVVIAMGIILLLTMIDNIQTLLFDEPIYFLSGSLIGLLIAYLVRFSTISYNATESGLLKIKKNIDLTVKSFGYSTFMTLKNIHLPMMKFSIMTAFILVFVDIVKELPATLILRPFNFDTLAIHIYELAEAEQLSNIATPALMLIIISMIPVIILINNTINKKDADTETRN